MIANDSPPLRHLHRMHLIFSGNLPDRFDAHQRFQSNFGLEGTCVPLALSSFAHGSAVLSSPAEPEKSNLDHCPNFGVHFSFRPWLATPTHRNRHRRSTIAHLKFLDHSSLLR